MVLYLFVDFLRGSGLVYGFHPWGVEELDERKRKHHQEKDHAREQYHHRKELPEVCVEDDVSKPEGRHGDDGPIEARHPRVILPFVGRDVVEENAERDVHHEQDPHKAHQLLDVRLIAPRIEKVVELRSEVLHARG